MELVIKEIKPLICLSMIVKDESHIIVDTLTKFLNKVSIDYWVISDTGSTDNTQEIIKTFFKERGIPGELYEDKWENFAHNRTLALKHAHGKSDYIFVFDADDELCGDFQLPVLTEDAYHIQFGDANGTSYTRVLLVNNNTKKWRYLSVIHEFIDCVDNSHTSGVIAGNYYCVSGRSGNRSKDPDKYLKDALVLEKAHAEALAKNDLLYFRYAFYCANSYFDYGKYMDAIKWYKITLGQGNWEQEKYVSCMKLFVCYNILKQPEAAMFYLVKGILYDKTRVEGLFELVQYYCGNDMNELAYMYYGMVKEFYEKEYVKIQHTLDKLFVDISKANFHLPYWMIIVADRIKKYDTGIAMYRIIFTKKFKETNKHLIGNMLFNLQFFIDKVDKNDTQFFTLFKEYIDFLLSLQYPVFDHDFMINYEKYGIVVPKKDIHRPIFTKEACATSNKILIYTGFMNVLWNDSYVSTQSIGGAEKAVTYLSRYFPKNYEIIISGDVADEVIGNITYVNRHKLQELLEKEKFHTIVVSRYVSFFLLYRNFSCYQLFLSAHDSTGFINHVDNNIMSVDSVILNWNYLIDGVITLTNWHKDNVIAAHPYLKDKMHIINNGILTHTFPSCKNKIKNKFVWTSCSYRGLHVILHLWKDIIENIPDATLDISSYNAFPENENDVKMLEIMNKYDSIKHHGMLNTTQLYDLISKAEYWLYTNTFPETSCITGLEMLMSEVICLYYPLAGLLDTVGNYGIQVNFGNEINTILNLSEGQKIAMRKRGREYALSCSWENRAKEWCKVLFVENPSTTTIVAQGDQSYSSTDVPEYNQKTAGLFATIRFPPHAFASCSGSQHTPSALSSEYNLKNNIKVINLKKREDRKKSMIEQFERENITSYDFIEAVNGNELHESEELRLLFKGNDFNYRKGVIGCSLSHIQLWNTLINDNDNEYYIILEDDLELFPGFKKNLECHCKLFEEKQLEHLSLGVIECNELDQEKIKTKEITIFQKDIYKFMHLTFAYIISKNAAKKLVSYINNSSIKCAMDYPLAHGEVILYHHTTCCLAKQKNITSFGTDIQHDYNHLQFHTSNIQNSLKIAYCDWWYEEYCGGNFDVNNNFITDILKKYGDVVEIVVVDPTQNPDVLFYSIFGNEHTKYTNVRRIFFSGEPFGIRAEADFNFTFDKNSDKNTRFPLWLGYMNDYLLEECQRRKSGIINVPKRNRFCSFIANGEVKTTHRRTIIEKLSMYKKVDCGGNYLNNIGYNVPRGINCSGKIEHNNNYKFAIAFENEDYPGYVTEKICDIYKSNSIPIYWGTKGVVQDFNPSTFINARDFNNFDELVEHIIKVDNDDDLYANYFKEPMFSNKWLYAFNDHNKTFYKNLSDCIIGKNTNLFDNYLKSINNNNTSTKFKIGFYDNGLCERGTTTALYSYAHYAEKYFNCDSIIFYDIAHHANNSNVIKKFNDRFKVYGCSNFEQIDIILLNENIKYFYNTCGGKINSTTLVKNSKNLIHAVFQIEPFGDIYSAVSHYIINKSEYKYIKDVPCMIDLPIDCNSEYSPNMRFELHIPIDALVLGRYGGKHQFDLVIAHNAIKNILEQDDNIYFLFVNTAEFYNHPRIIYLDIIVDPIQKVKYINTCDAMIHARSDGETFGLAIAEFSTLNKPIITCKSNMDNCHIDILGEKAIIYDSEENLIDIFKNIRIIIKSRHDWNAYKEYTPEKVMKKFNEVFLPNETFIEDILIDYDKINYIDMNKDIVIFDKGKDKDKDNKNLVIVSAFLDIDRGSWNNCSKRTASYYIDSFLNYLNYDNKMVVFIDEKYISEINEKYNKTKHNNKFFIPINKEWMDKNIYAWQQLHKSKKIMESNFYKSLVQDRINTGYHPENIYPEYNSINHSKIDFICYALNNNIINKNDFICWSDFGYFNSILHNNPNEYPFSSLDINNFNTNTLSFCLRNKLDRFDSNMYKTLVEAPEKFTGSFFSGPMNLMLKLQALYHKSLEELYSNNLSDDDQHIYLRCFLKEPDIFTLYLDTNKWPLALSYFEKKINKLELANILLSNIKNGIFVEIGCDTGSFSNYLLETNKECVLYSIDPYICYEEYVDSINNITGDNLYNQTKQYLNNKFGHRFNLIRKFSNQSKDDVPNNLDFVYIDGNHKYKYVYEDLCIFYEKLSPNGIIIGDDAVDIDESKRNSDGDIFIEWLPGSYGDYGVIKAFNDFIKKNKCYGKKIGNQFLISKTSPRSVSSRGCNGTESVVADPEYSTKVPCSHVSLQIYNI